MALDQGKLADALTNIATSFPASYGEAGQRWAQAYGAYAADARSTIEGVPNVAGAIPVLASALGAAFASGAAAGAMQAAFVAFWGSPPIAFAGTFPGLVTFPGAGPNLAPVFASNVDGKKSAADACAAIAAELHLHALTVIVTSATTPSPTIGPIH